MTLGWTGLKMLSMALLMKANEMKAKEMREKLQRMHDFKYEKTKAEILLLNNG